MARVPKEITDFMAKFGVLSDEIWEVRAGAWAIKHKALERVAVEQKIAFSSPQVLQIDLPNKFVGMFVAGQLADRSEWATGEAAPYNNKNGYPLAMAEKRAKDRVTLKLLQVHGSLYSEEEFEQKRENPHVNKPKDIIDADVEYDEHGEPVDNIPSGDPGIERLPKAKARNDFDAAQKEMHATVTLKQLEVWAANNANRIQSFPADWAEMFRGLYAQHRDVLRGKAAA